MKKTVDNQSTALLDSLRAFDIEIEDKWRDSVKAWAHAIVQQVINGGAWHVEIDKRKWAMGMMEDVILAFERVKGTQSEKKVMSILNWNRECIFEEVVDNELHPVKDKNLEYLWEAMMEWYPDYGNIDNDE